MNLKQKIEYLMARDQIKTVAELSRALDIPYKTMDNLLKRDHFENVKFSTLRKLCYLFNVDLRYLCFDEITDPDFEINPSEPSALSPDEQKLIDDYRTFNAEGQEKIRDYVADLKDNLKYKKHPESLMDQEA